MLNTAYSKLSLKKFIILLLIVISCLTVFSACSVEPKTEVLTDVTKVQIIDSAELRALSGFDTSGQQRQTLINISKVEIKGELVTIFVGNFKVATTHIQNVIFFYN